jgi:hypothetical protein
MTWLVRPGNRSEHRRDRSSRSRMPRGAWRQRCLGCFRPASSRTASASCGHSARGPAACSVRVRLGVAQLTGWRARQAPECSARSGGALAGRHVGGCHPNRVDSLSPAGIRFVFTAMLMPSRRCRANLRHLGSTSSASRNSGMKSDVSGLPSQNGLRPGSRHPRLLHG